MKTSNQLFIDNLFIRPIIVLLNFVVILLGKILRIDHELKDKSFKKIAVCKYKGLGSIIQATPLLRTLKKQYPAAEITFISSIANKEFLNRINSIDKIILLNDSSTFKLLISFPRLILGLLGSRFDVYVDLEVYSNFSSLVTILSAARNRLGFYLQSKKYRMGNYTHMMFYNTNSPISQTYLQFARLLNCNEIITDISHLRSQTSQIKLKENNINLEELDYIVINPNASDLRYERRWGHKKYIALIKELLKIDLNSLIILIGGKSEKNYVAKITSDINSERLIDLSGKTNIDELIGIIDKADLMITNDSGPMHIAFSCQTRIIALFGPCAPQQYGYYANSLSIYTGVYCSPCIHDFVNPPCKGNNICMKSISVDTVLNAVKNYDKEVVSKTHQTNISSILYQGENIVYGEITRT